MKTKIKMLIFALIVGGMACLISCEKDEGGGDDPNDICDVKLCSDDNDLKQKCIDAYNECADYTPEANLNECVVIGRVFCGL